MTTYLTKAPFFLFTWILSGLSALVVPFSFTTENVLP